MEDLQIILALRFDFSLIETFSMIDHSGKGFMDQSDFAIGLEGIIERINL